MYSKILVGLSNCLFVAVTLFSLYMSWHLNNVWVLTIMIPNAAAYAVFCHRAYTRKAEAENLVKLQKQCAKNMTPEQFTQLIESINKYPIKSELENSSSVYDSYRDSLTDIVEGEADG